MLLSLVLACETPNPEGEAHDQATVVRVALNWYPEPEFGGFYDALLTKAYRDAGLDVQIIPGGPGVPVLEMLAANKVDVAISGADDLLLRRAKGLAAVAILAGFQDTPVGLMVHAGGPTKFEDVTGSVAIEPGSPFQQFLWKKYGWDGKVAMVPTSGSVGAFAADPALIQQAYITSEPCVAEAQNVPVTFIPGKDAGWNPYASLAVVRETDASAPWVTQFKEMSISGWKHYNADPTVANAEIARLNPEMPLDRMACVVERQRPYVTGKDGIGVMTQQRWDELAQAFATVGTQVTAIGAWR